MKALKSLKFWKKKNKAPAPIHPVNLVAISHEASRTGAPKIIARLLDHFKNHYHVNRYTLLHNPGPIYREFGIRSHVTCLNLKRKPSWKLNRKIGQFVRSLDRSKPTLVLCNSMESRFIAQALGPYQLPMVYLVHELPSSYSTEDYSSVYGLSKKVIFPARIVSDSANSAAPLPAGKGTILPQGLLDEGFGTRFDRQQARQEIREELGLPQDAIVMLGCGTLDMRKGIDHFANIARQWHQSAEPGQRPVHFVWIGGGFAGRHSIRHFVDIDLKYSAAQDYVHFIGERDSVEKYFSGGDGFLMTSRVDPFPCVIHEAMAAQIPIIAFDQAGGAPEAIGSDAGFVVPYGDYAAVTQLIGRLATDASAFDQVRATALDRVRNDYSFYRYGEQVAELCAQYVPELADCRKPTAAEPAILKFPTPETRPAANAGIRKAA